MFSWFGRKKTEPKTEQSSAVETTTPEDAGPSAETELSAAEAVVASDLSVETEKQAASVATDPVTVAAATTEAPQAVVEPAVETVTSSTETVQLEPIAEQTERESSVELKSSLLNVSAGQSDVAPTPAEEQSILIPEPEPEPETRARARARARASPRC